MKNILLLLLTLIVAPAWAEDVSVATSITEPAAQAVHGNKANCGQLAFLSINLLTRLRASLDARATSSHSQCITRLTGRLSSDFP